jgi:hypothetical protein
MQRGFWAKKRGRGYFRYHLESGKFEWGLDEVTIEMEKFLEGEFFLITNNKKMKGTEIIMAYKDFIRVRPVYHWKAQRVESHVFLCVLAHFLEKMLGRGLQEAKIKMTAQRALDSVRTVKLAQLKIWEQILQTVTKPGSLQQGILKAVLEHKA